MDKYMQADRLMKKYICAQIDKKIERKKNMERYIR